jgi:hypothetical protein
LRIRSFQVKGITTIVKTTNFQTEDGMGTEKDKKTQEHSEWGISESF